MDTVPSLQEQINALQKRVEILEKRKAQQKSTKKRSPLTTAEEQEARQKMLSILLNLPNDAMITARFISQQTALLRRMGTAKVRKELDDLAQRGVLRKEGKGISAVYCQNR